MIENSYIRYRIRFTNFRAHEGTTPSDQSFLSSDSIHKIDPTYTSRVETCETMFFGSGDFSFSDRRSRENSFRIYSVDECRFFAHTQGSRLFS